ncbi:MAG: 16S rRNA (cytosine(967)-C(5))-methyltransferase RsmB [Betaproteobacteria bacterium]|nr:16S rRNA (cytosine(967)-C(5))-methyltransferase RsmB [Betaproteobacteria bacterium]
MTRMAALAPALAEAARAVAGVAAGRSLEPPSELGEARSAVLDLCNGTLRRYGRVQALVRWLSRKGEAAPQVQALLWCALYALDSGRYAAYTVVDQAVRACALIEQWPARGYVNGVLRNYLRDRDSLERRVLADVEARYQHPSWWIETLQREQPQRWQLILEAGNTHPPMCLRANRRRVQAADYLAQLDAAGLPARSLGECALLLEKPVPVERLPGFAQGLVSVQDAGAQHGARLLDLVAGQRVLDACAAPGGKSAHILESADVELTALDADAARAARVAPGLARLGLAARVLAADCTALDAWWDGRPYDRVLADVPCTGSGVVRRHPDIKWLRRADDVRGFARRQAAILDALWRVLAPGGKLLYVTCSVFREENDAVLESFSARAARVRRAPLPESARAQLLPCAEHDGFYYGLLEKAA